LPCNKAYNYAEINVFARFLKSRDIYLYIKVFEADAIYISIKHLFTVYKIKFSVNGNDQKIFLKVQLYS
jgi:hypothetical protein